MNKEEPVIDVFIPVYNPDEKFSKLMDRLMKQSVSPAHIYLLHTIESPAVDISTFYKPEEGFKGKILEVPIDKSDFDHGGTRAYGARLSDAEFLLFMTQDAVPASPDLLMHLLERFEEKRVSAAYARQLPRKEAKTVETLIRHFNYPDKDRHQNLENLEKYGIKTYFCSDVCAMYRRSVYEEMGGFVTKTIFNEDMIMAADMVTAGYEVVYAADAAVIHSHSYTPKEQFTRNFDLAVSQVQYKRVFEGISSESEGITMVKSVCRHLWKQGKVYEIPGFILDCGAKFLGFRLGKMYEKLPEKVVLACSMNKGYWKK